MIISQQIFICQRLLSPCMPHPPSPLLPHPRLHPSGQQWSEQQLRLLAARHPRGVSQRATSGSERGGGQPHLTFPEEHPQTALPLQGQLSSPPLIPRSTSLHRSPTQVLLLRCRSKLCCRLCFRTETRRRRLPRVKEKRAPCEVFPSSRFVGKTILVFLGGGGL